jgi:hypothetical protein
MTIGSSKNSKLKDFINNSGSKPSLQVAFKKENLILGEHKSTS